MPSHLRSRLRACARAGTLALLFAGCGDSGVPLSRDAAPACDAALVGDAAAPAGDATPVPDGRTADAGADGEGLTIAMRPLRTGTLAGYVSLAGTAAAPRAEIDARLELAVADGYSSELTLQMLRIWSPCAAPVEGAISLERVEGATDAIGARLSGTTALAISVQGPGSARLVVSGRYTHAGRACSQLAQGAEIPFQVQIAARALRPAGA